MIWRLLLSLAVLSATPALAQDLCISRDLSVSPELEALARLDVKECAEWNQKEDARLRSEAELQYREVLLDGPVIERSILGRKLKGTEKELAALEATLEGKLHSRWKSASSICSSAFCVISHVVDDEELARRLFLFHARTGYGLSLTQEENVFGNQMREKIWSLHEVREFDSLSQKMPTELKRLSGLQRMVRVANGFRAAGDASTVAFTTPSHEGSGAIVFYDVLEDPHLIGRYRLSSVSYAQQTLLHEICHNWDFQKLYQSEETLMSSESKEFGFRQISGWVADPFSRRGWKAEDPGAGFVTRYAKTQPSEDFAESCAAYVLAPHDLKLLSPSKYEFIKKKLFAGKEFLDEPWAKNAESRPQGDWPLLTQVRNRVEGSCGALKAKCASQTPSADRFELAVISEPCFLEGRAKMIDQILGELSSAPEYCERGGRRRILDLHNMLCSRRFFQ
jgi:hypothetical protein